MKDIIRMQQLAGIITENQARKMITVLNEENYNTLLESQLTTDEKIKIILPLWRNYKNTPFEEREKRENIKNQVLKYTTLDNGSYVWSVLDSSTENDVIKVIKKQESIASGDTLSNESNFLVKLLVPIIYFNPENNELSNNKYEWYTKDELKYADQTSYRKGSDLIEWVFNNDYETAKQFESNYPNLFKVIKK